jgi:hypothetical protein
MFIQVNVFTIIWGMHTLCLLIPQHQALHLNLSVQDESLVFFVKTGCIYSIFCLPIHLAKAAKMLILYDHSATITVP